MGKISEFKQEDYDVIARDYADLKEAARKRCHDQYELDLIQKMGLQNYLQAQIREEG